MELIRAFSQIKQIKEGCIFAQCKSGDKQDCTPVVGGKGNYGDLLMMIDGS
jgi:hypothetical protein